MKGLKDYLHEYETILHFHKNSGHNLKSFPSRVRHEANIIIRESFNSQNERNFDILKCRFYSQLKSLNENQLITFLNYIEPLLCEIERGNPFSKKEEKYLKSKNKWKAHDELNDLNLKRQNGFEVKPSVVYFLHKNKLNSFFSKS